MDLLSLAATQSEQHPPIHPPVPPYHQHQRSSSASDFHSYQVYHHHRTSSLQHLNSGDTSMEAISPTSGPHGSSASVSHPGSVSPHQPQQQQQVVPKNVSFELYFPESPTYRARLPMRVSIYPHDTTDSIVTTVKNFYGLYSGPTTSMSISFQDGDGNTLIARYENFTNNMPVYVRVIEEAQANSSAFGFHPPPVGAQPYYGDEGYQQPPMPAPPTVRPDSRTSHRRSPSPNRGRRSASTSTNGKKGRSRSVKNRNPSSGDDNGYSSGDAGSVSGKAKEQIGNTEISLDNIVEGNRRKRAKFESSELPLFAPPQMPATTSNPSVSPARRVEHHRPSLPFVPQGQNPFTNPHPLQSPQSYSNGFAQPSMYSTPVDRRARNSVGYSGGAGGVLPTPDPTVHSCMSEEDKDVALQLMRLGDMSNVSHGRTSASTLDDTFSGRADAASSTGATSDAASEDDEELPAPRKQKLDATGASRKVFHGTASHFASPQSNNLLPTGDQAPREESTAMNAPKLPKPAPKPKAAKPRTQSVSKPKSVKPKAGRPAGVGKTKKSGVVGAGPMSPAAATAAVASAVAAPQKQSVTAVPNPSLQPGEEESPDLSTKPRCQRCRKSKKGCDRQRPCGRCRDAGLGADQCISEDEGNGRKGRYGRHMGVPIKKDEAPGHQPTLLPAAPIQAAPMSTTAIPPPAIPTDKSKKRKR
ncbi:hypothetical protein MKZ38_000853 [Zalerion maritima]|uniref:Zn(2)-C6 fungal-type domain-containing protein n=1 Tax=Zalerion maritima TaxID=339359 RepID=A0AAD5RZA6_9PEZI|nr:hypothetical protein MKZ38_000853 [Zalerion maritima]